MDGPELYRAIGGAAGCRRFSTAFYARVRPDPVLGPLFPGKTMTCAIEEFAAFLVQFLGGAPEDSQRRHRLGLRDSHARFALGPRERAAWLRVMGATLEASGLPDAAVAELRALFGRVSSHVIGTEPPAAELSAEVAGRWDEH